MPLQGNANISINLKIDYPQKEIPSIIITRAINNLEEAIYNSEYYETMLLTTQCVFEEPIEPHDIPQLFRSAIDYGYDQSKGINLTISSINQGSVIIEGAIVGIALYILKNTLGETLKEAWKKTKAHEKIRDILLSRRDTRAEDIALNFKEYMSADAQIKDKLGISPDVEFHLNNDSQIGSVISIFVVFSSAYEEIKNRENLLVEFEKFVSE